MSMVQRVAATADGAWDARAVEDFPGSPFQKIGRDWMLISAGTKEDWNTMTASWGGLGVLWNKPVAFVFVRPTRYTFDFMDKGPVFSLSFFDPSYKKALAFCGAHSGRNTDKAEGSGLSPIVFEDGTISFSEAAEVLTCRTLYTQDLLPGRFADGSLETHYPNKDYHRLYVAELTALRIRRP